MVSAAKRASAAGACEVMDVNTFWKLSLAVGCAAGAAWFKWCGVMHDRYGQSDSGRGLVDSVLVPDRHVSRGEANPMKDKDGNQHGTVIDMEAYFTARHVVNWARRHDLHRTPDVRF